MLLLIDMTVHYMLRSFTLICICTCLYVHTHIVLWKSWHQDSGCLSQGLSNAWACTSAWGPPDGLWAGDAVSTGSPQGDSDVRLQRKYRGAERFLYSLLTMKCSLKCQTSAKGRLRDGLLCVTAFWFQNIFIKGALKCGASSICQLLRFPRHI